MLLQKWSGPSDFLPYNSQPTIPDHRGIWLRTWRHHLSWYHLWRPWLVKCLRRCKGPRRQCSRLPYAGAHMWTLLTCWLHWTPVLRHNSLPYQCFHNPDKWRHFSPGGLLWNKNRYAISRWSCGHQRVHWNLPTQHTGPEISAIKVQTCSCPFQVLEGPQDTAVTSWYRSRQWRCSWKQNTIPTAGTHLCKVLVVIGILFQTWDKMCRKLMKCHQFDKALLKWPLRCWLLQPGFLRWSYTFLFHFDSDVLCCL